MSCTYTHQGQTFTAWEFVDYLAGLPMSDLMKYLPEKARAQVAMASAAGRKQTETPEFKKWFGDSKIVNSDGKPLVVYHGTKASFNEFDSLKVGTASDQGWYGSGFYFTPDPEVASDVYAKRVGDGTDGANVMPVYLSIKNPYDWRSENSIGLFQNNAGASLEKRAELEERGFDGVVVYDDYLQLKDGEMLTDEQWSLLPETTKFLGRERASRSLSSKEWGYEIIANSYGKEFADSLPKSRRVLLEVVAFKPTQIKSATGNNGQFDGSNPDIRASIDFKISDFAGKVTETASDVFSKETPSTIKSWIKSQLTQRRPFMLGFLTLDQIADIYGKTMESVKRFSTEVQKMDTEKQKISDSADKVVERWRQLDSKEADRLADIMHEAHKTPRTVATLFDFAAIGVEDAITKIYTGGCKDPLGV